MIKGMIGWGGGGTCAKKYAVLKGLSANNFLKNLVDVCIRAGTDGRSEASMEGGGGKRGFCRTP